MRIVLAMLLFGLAARSFAQQTTDEASRAGFRVIDIYLDSRGAPLAAYQLEFADTNSVAKIVGIEGGESPAFSPPPYYDPKAMQQERVIIAAFSTNSPAELPHGRTRAATIHVQTSGTGEPRFELKLQAAADSTGTKLLVDASFEERKMQ
jgi:hypothetical protein